jgi:zinc transport system substrate-binding protein
MKKVVLSIIVVLISFCVSGCLKSDSMEDISIYTTTYPIEFITTNLYGEHSKISSIYPDNTNVKTYHLSDKQLTDYSKSDLLIYNGLSDEKDYAVAMLNKNKNIKIIDATMSMEYTNGIEELWLDPSNLLMLAQNTKNGFKEYLTNAYLETEVDNNYDALKIKISEIDADLKLVAENATNKTLVVSNDLLLFLQKYNLNVISLEDNDNLTAKKIADVKSLINNKVIKYIYTLPNEQLNSTINNFINNNGIQVIALDTGESITEEQRTEKIDFIKIMTDNIELLKEELYK